MVGVGRWVGVLGLFCAGQACTERARLLCMLLCTLITSDEYHRTPSGTLYKGEGTRGVCVLSPLCGVLCVRGGGYDSSRCASFRRPSVRTGAGIDQYPPRSPMGRRKHDASKSAFKVALAASQANHSSWLPPEWHPSRLPEDFVHELRGAIGQMGHLGRLRRVLDRVARNEPIVVAGLGNSVTADFGGVVGAMQDRFPIGYIGTPRRSTGRHLLYGWLLPVFQYLTEHEIPAGSSPEQSSAIVNCGQAARFLSNYLDCMHTTLPVDADLIFIDGVNGLHPINGNQFKPTERLLRRLLALPRQPAVIVIHWLDWCGCANCRPGPRTDRHRNGSCYVEDGPSQSWLVGKLREESGWGSLVRHYQLPVLSMRQALHPLSPNRRSAPIGADAPYPYRASRAMRRFTFDGLHPQVRNLPFRSVAPPRAYSPRGSLLLTLAEPR